METVGSLAGHLAQVDPAALVALVSMVALFAVVECVKHLCRAMGKRGDD